MSSPESAHAEAACIAVDCRDEEALENFAQRLAKVLPPRAMLAIAGDLGAGKTTFVKKLAAAVGVDPAEVTSPTFTLVHVYEVPIREGGAQQTPRLVHIDAYRLTGLDDLATIGWEEFAAGDGWLAVEWPERIAAALPAERLELQIEITGVSSRSLHLQATSPALRAAAVAAASC